MSEQDLALSGAQSARCVCVGVSLVGFVSMTTNALVFETEPSRNKFFRAQTPHPLPLELPISVYVPVPPPPPPPPPPPEPEVAPEPHRRSSSMRVTGNTYRRSVRGRSSDDLVIGTHLGMGTEKFQITSIISNATNSPPSHSPHYYHQETLWICCLCNSIRLCFHPE